MRYLLIILWLFWVPSFAMAKQTNKVYYQMMFESHEIMCSARLNGIYLFSTESVQEGIPQQVSMTQSISEYMNEGTNILTMNGINLSRYSKRPEKAYCEIDIVAMEPNYETGEIESKLISNIRYTYKKMDEDSGSPYPYELSIEESKFNLDHQLTNRNINLENFPPLKDGGGHDVQKIVASRDIYVNHSVPFRWVHKSTPFEDTPENRQLLWEKYNEIREAIHRKNKRAIRKIVDVGVTDMAAFNNDDVDDRFNLIFSQVFQNYFDMDITFWQTEPLTLNDYDLEIYADGKLFRFNEKNKILTSPLRWKNYAGIVRRINPIFTYIDGKIEVATF